GVPHSFSYIEGQPENAADFTLFWETWNTLQKKYPFAQPTDQEKIYAAIQGLSAAYKDPYTVFFPPEESKIFNDDISGSFGGVGMEVGTRDGLLTVIAPLQGTPA